MPAPLVAIWSHGGRTTMQKTAKESTELPRLKNQKKTLFSEGNRLEIVDIKNGHPTRT
jgi:hypothetical protein